MEKEYTFILPCLNEEKTLEYCIKEIQKTIEEKKLDAEILVSDNGSTDNSIKIAEKNGVRVVICKEKGYGSALINGTNNAKGKYCIMGDSDGSYDFYNIDDFIKKLMEDLSKKFEIDFLYIDFRKGFWQGHEKAIEQGLYMQKYCGCIFSEEQSFLDNTNNKPKLPDGFEFLPVKKSINIKKERNNKEQFINLLLEADPSIDMINRYLKNADLFVLTYNESIACVAVVSKIDENTVELKKIVTKKEYRGKGYGKKMLKYLADNYKVRYKKMIVGTSENNIPFYVKQGFDKYEKTVKNFGEDNYDEKIRNENAICIDKYYYSKNLNKKQ